MTNGEVYVLMDGNKYNLKEDDLIIINSKEIYSTKSEKSNIKQYSDSSVSRYIIF